jgi:decaprenylphospho-beta-D-erythro-pentofuranosid-2-ulose 2-reductase
MRRILILGATSAIAEATARIFAKQGDALFLVGRCAERLAAIGDDLRLRGASLALVHCQDLTDDSKHEQILDRATAGMGGLDMALIAYGTLSDQARSESSIDALKSEFQTNAVSVMSLCTVLANRFEAQRHGVIGVISSVAGDRGRRSNYVYGAAKAALTAFTSGLRQRLYRKGVRVVTIKPGFVDTPMTAAFPKGALWASPQSVGAQIARALVRGSPVLYTPRYWRAVMWAVRCIPETIFRQLSP